MTTAGMTLNTLNPLEQTFMISPRMGLNDDTSNKCSYPPVSETCFLETFHQYPYGDFRPTFYNPFEIKPRRRTSRAQLDVLENAFLENSKPNSTVRRLLAQKLQMTPRGVQIWFQNRRAKEKSIRKQQSVESELEKEPVEGRSSLLFSQFFPNDSSTDNWQQSEQQKKYVHDSIRMLATTAAAVAVASSNQYHTSLNCYNDWARDDNALTQTKNATRQTNEAPLPIFEQDSVYLLPSWPSKSNNVLSQDGPQSINLAHSFNIMDCHELAFDYVTQSHTPPLTAACSIAGSPNSIDKLYNDPNSADFINEHLSK